MKILCLEKFNSLETPAILNQLGQVDEFIQYVPNDRTPLLAQLEKGNYNALFVGLAHQIDKEVLDLCPNLKVVATRTTGLDHIDLDECEKRGIEVLSLRGEDEFLKTIPATAEWTFLNMGMLLRKTGHELKGKTLGLIGYGRIGKLMENYALAFGMKVLKTDNKIDTGVSLHEVLAVSDIISLHITADEENRGYMSVILFSTMKWGSWFLNSSRDWLVNQEDLGVALESGRLVDAWSDFPAHRGGKTIESLIATEKFMALKLIEYVKESNKNL